MPSEAAKEFLRSEKGAWDPELAPMMLEPLDQFANREYQGIVFVGSARTSKTMSLVLGGITYITTCAPGDILVTLMSQDSARDFSKMDLDRMLRHSPAVGEQLSPRASDDNVYDKFLRSGTVIKIGWPAITQLSQKTIRYVLLTDYDRPKNRDNVDGEGPLWELGFKRVETFMSRGKCMAESSPEAEYLDPTWKPATQHEAPPCGGILELYNRGTRARWYWPCPSCGDPFEALPGL
jgi:phage terminase large subunit GpA-like protein